LRIFAQPIQMRPQDSNNNRSLIIYASPKYLKEQMQIKKTIGKNKLDNDQHLNLEIDSQESEYQNRLHRESKK